MYTILKQVVYQMQVIAQQRTQNKYHAYVNVCGIRE
jgi:hypothetical protein